MKLSLEKFKEIKSHHEINLYDNLIKLNRRKKLKLSNDEIDFLINECLVEFEKVNKMQNIINSHNG